MISAKESLALIGASNAESPRAIRAEESLSRLAAARGEHGRTAVWDFRGLTSGETSLPQKLVNVINRSVGIKPRAFSSRDRPRGGSLSEAESARGKRRFLTRHPCASGAPAFPLHCGPACCEGFSSTCLDEERSAPEAR